MSERLQQMGRLEEIKQEQQLQRILILDSRKSLREALDPFCDPEELKGAEIAMRAVELAARLVQYKNLLEKIKALKDELGIKD